MIFTFRSLAIQSLLTSLQQGILINENNGGSRSFKSWCFYLRIHFLPYQKALEYIIIPQPLTKGQIKLVYLKNTTYVNNNIIIMLMPQGICQLIRNKLILWLWYKYNIHTKGHSMEVKFSAVYIY